MRLYGTKYCSSCDKFLPASKFGSHATKKWGLTTTCKECIKLNTLRKKRNMFTLFDILLVEERKKYLEENDLKHCNKCGRDLNKNYFFKNYTANDGIGWHCKDCRHEYKIEYKLNSPEYIVRQARIKYLEENNLKYCAKCKRDLDKGLFYSNKARDDELDTYCKKCTSDKCRIYREEHVNEIFFKRKIWYIENKGAQDERVRQWAINNPEREIERHKVYRENNPEKVKAAALLYYEKNRRKILDYNRVYKQERCILSVGKPLNAWFEGSDFHHLIYDENGNMDLSIGIHIPRLLHRSVKHSMKTGEGLYEINKLAWEFLRSQLKANLNDFI